MNIEFRTRSIEAQRALDNQGIYVEVRVGERGQESISIDEFCRRMSRLGQRLKALHETVRNETEQLAEDHYL